jgi:DNA polymerase III gamma/tau subunit
MPKLDNETLLIAFVAVAGLALLLQTIMLLAISVAVRKTANALREEVENLRSAAMPVLYDTRDLLANTQTTIANAQDFLASAQAFFTRVAPKVESATTDIVQIAHGLRIQATEMQSSATEIMERVHRQTDRVDGMVTNLLDTVDRAGGYVANAVSKPVRQVSSMLNSVKAIVASLRSPIAGRRPNPVPDEDRFF